MENFFDNEKQDIIATLLDNGVSLKQATVIADCFATTDLYGVHSHGKLVLDEHIQKIQRGGYNLSPNFKIIRQTSAFAVVDGDNSIGMVSADFCMRYAIEKSKESGIYTVFSRNNNTMGAAFYYPLLAAQEGLIGIIFSNSPAQMAPIGGKEKMLGTNPFSVVIPVPNAEPIIIDMATSIVAKSKFKQYKLEGKKLPDGWALDVNGLPTNDPDEGMQGLILPMAGFKGYAISMLIDILSGVVSGAAYLNKVGRFYTQDNSVMNVGFCCIAIDPYIVLGEEYSDIINDYVNSLRNSQKIDGQEISLPGDDRIHYKNRNIQGE